MLLLLVSSFQMVYSIVLFFFAEMGLLLALTMELTHHIATVEPQYTTMHNTHT